MSVRTLALAAAAWLLATGTSPAQSPPAPDAEQRLRALEGKMDRILKALEPREARRLATSTRSATATAAVTAARDAVATELKAKEGHYLEFQHADPFRRLGGIKSAGNVYADRLGKIESRRADLKIKKEEMVDQLSRIEKALKD